MRITVLGSGAYGSVLGHLLEDKKHEVAYFSLETKNTLKEALDGAETIILAIPSKAVSKVLPKLPKDLPLVVATKGFLTPAVFADFEDIMIMSGPGFAADIEAHQKTRLVATDLRIRDLFGTPWLKFDLSADEKGVMLCGALKNVYAIYAGQLNLRPGTAEHEKFIATAFEELKAILFANGANPKTASLPCGIDDLKLSCDFPSRNYEFGQGLNVGKTKPEKTVEGIATLEHLRAGEIKVPAAAGILKKIIKESATWA